ncbi:hypothetical protein AOXY_G4977 [Acipenser oxyrinchus oxyrinchus]|uniref:Uncharacterized protein n=1 Tax=Acipenser oxyrinchus oxyrinchus TaxID=40147 RepID=A0AAD8LR49_ACIOX|nr:hypothetical protein AOXY_G4977 [Acipenser oxyrinchus oxyrinchus]
MTSASNVNCSLAAASGSNIISMFIQGKVTGDINMAVKIKPSDDQLREFTQGLGKHSDILLTTLIKSQDDLQSKVEETQRQLGQMSQYIQSNQILASLIQEYTQQNQGLVKEFTYQLDEGEDEDSRQLKQFVRKIVEEVRPGNAPSREVLIHGFWAVVAVAVTLSAYFYGKLRSRKVQLKYVDEPQKYVQEKDEDEEDALRVACSSQSQQSVSYYK